jgi:hypothetical protein
MTVPEEELLPDLARDEHDSTLQRGMEEARAISEAARDQGRTRKMSPTTTTTTTQPSYNKGTKDAPEEEVVLVEDLEATDVATTRSSLGRRRSEKRSLVPSQDSKEGSRVWHGKSSMENTEKMKRNSHVSIECLSCVASLDVCSCDLHRSARAALPPG